MTTITTSPHRAPLLAAVAASAALVVGGALGAAVGIAWEHDDHPTVASQTQAQTQTQAHETTPIPGGATTADEFSGTTSGSVPVPAGPGGATTGQESTQ